MDDHQAGSHAGPSRSTSLAAPTPARTPAKRAVKGEAASPSPAARAGQGAGSGDEQDDDEDEDRPGVDTLRAFAKQVAAASALSGAAPIPRVIIPRRGEKDFEPLNATQAIQGKMLRESRQALIDALGGVRGAGSKTISHAVLDEGLSKYARVKVARGNMFTSMGHTVRAGAAKAPAGKDKAPVDSHSELLPEEALYLLERGSMQIWIHPQGERQLRAKAESEWRQSPPS